MNNETVGISAELAIADEFEVPVNREYRQRGDENIKSFIQGIVREVFCVEELPFPIKHIAEHQNPVYFILEGNKTMSVKTNKLRLGMVAPQVIGQPTTDTYFEFLFDTFGYDINEVFELLELEDNTSNRIRIFKEYSVENISSMLSEYWKYLFKCDFYVHFYNIIRKDGTLTTTPKCIVLKDLPRTTTWEKEKISFTKDIDNWNDSCTVKYYGISIGELQTHHNRNCLKFRFKLRGILKLLNRGIL